MRKFSVEEKGRTFSIMELLNYSIVNVSRDPIKDKEKDCIGLGPGKTGEDCYSVCYENNCNSALAFQLTCSAFAFLLFCIL